MSALWTSAEAEAATLGQASRGFTAMGLSIDSRTLNPGDLFVALQGDNRDGHAFVRAAMEAQAAAALVSQLPADGKADWPLLTVANTQRGLEDMARAARARSHAKIIAVTGSAGKTTTKEMLRLALGALGKTHASAASYNNHWGVPLSLAALPLDARFSVFEIGMNHFGEIRALVGFVKPHVALVTTIAAAHLEFFGTCDAIADAKSEIFEGLMPGGAALIPSDNAYAHRLAARAKQAGVSQLLRFGADGDARMTNYRETSEGTRFEADIMGRPVDVTLSASGRHLAQNALGVLLSVAALDGDVLNAAAALRDFAALKGRGARTKITAGAGTAELIDEGYNANPASMAAALAVLGDAQGNGQRIAVLGDMLELGPQSAALHAALAQDIERARVDRVFLCGHDMGTLWEALPPSRRGAYAATSAELAPHVAGVVRAGDVVLVKGSLGSRMAVILDALKAPKAG